MKYTEEPTVKQQQVAAIVVNQSWCKQCGICVAFCPKSVFEQAPDGSVTVARAEACISCEICERLCPDLAIELQWKDAG